MPDIYAALAANGRRAAGEAGRQRLQLLQMM